MVLFQGHDPVLEDAGVLVGDGGLQLQVETLLIEELAGTVKKMKHELHAGIGRQMNTIRFEAWCGEAWHQENAGGPILHDVGELLQDLRQALVVRRQRPLTGDTPSSSTANSTTSTSTSEEPEKEEPDESEERQLSKSQSNGRTSRQTEKSLGRKNRVAALRQMTWKAGNHFQQRQS